MSKSELFEEYRFPCEACGSDLRFDPVAEEMQCDHCGHHEPMVERAGAGTISEIDYHEGLRGADSAVPMEETRVTQCPNCAAQVSFDEDTHASECPYCATPVVLGTGTHRHIKPGGVVPFTLSEEAARDAMSAWIGGRWFAPSGLTQYARKGRKISGIYMPFWTYDAHSSTRYSGERGDVYFETRTVMRDGKPTKTRVAKTRWRPRSGQVTRFFDDVLVLASRALPEDYTKALAPWDMHRMAPYSPEYLAGFRAEAYTIDLEDGFQDAKAQMDRQITRDIRFDIGGDKQRIHHKRTQLRDVTFKHVLLPVWLAAYKYRGKTYRLVVNGQTGAVKGERPWSIWKISLAVLVVLLLIGAAFYGGVVSDDLMLRRSPY